MNHASASEGSGPTQTFILYAANGRVYATNVRQKLVDLGSLTEREDGYTYLLDGNKASGSSFKTVGAALKGIGDSTTFLFLDGQFTALQDLRGDSGPYLSGATQLEVTVPELEEAADSSDNG